MFRLGQGLLNYKIPKINETEAISKFELSGQQLIEEERSSDICISLGLSADHRREQTGKGNLCF